MLFTKQLDIAMSITEELKKDHDQQRDLLAQLAESQPNTEERASLLKELKLQLHAHADAEERSFYAPLMQHDETQDEARHSVHEHHEIEECLEALEKAESDTTLWRSEFNKLKKLVLHHLEEEEREVFPIAAEIIPESKQEKLGEEYNEQMEEETASA